MALYIHNIRFKHACNSSSDHDLLIFGSESTMPAEDVSAVYDGESEGERHYGWEDFVLIQKKYKLDWLGAILGYALVERNTPQYILDYFVKEWLEGHSLEAQMDHQSVLWLPCEYGTDLPSKQFFGELKEFVLNPRLAIVGGNDNEKGKDYGGESVLQRIGCLRGNDNCVCRKDERGDFWILYNQTTGMRIRLSFKDQVPAVAAEFPELVDMKLTNYCENDCQFCYQGSSPTADRDCDDYLWEWTSLLYSMKVFEVALGGGELFHAYRHKPYVLANILKEFRKAGIVPNITTADTTWIYNPELRDPVLEHCGRIAFSVSSTMSVEYLWDKLQRADFPREKTVFQVIEGVEYNLASTVSTCNNLRIPLVILGFKPPKEVPGRKPFNRRVKEEHVVRELEKIIEEAVATTWRPSIVSVDTLFIKRYADSLKGVDSLLYTGSEGTHSMYFDLTNETMGPTSYGDLRVVIPTDADTNNDWEGEVGRIFRSWQDPLFAAGLK